MPLFLSPLLLTVQWLLLFVLLTIYGAMWNGAQQSNQKGWVVAVLWSTVILVVLKGSYGIYRILFDLQAFS
jgi:succinate dehydrogenase/fumarate reductase cytochrome b subunit